MDFGGGDGGGGGPEQWFYNLPSVTRIWLGSTIIITALVNLDFIKWNDIDFTSFDDIVGHSVKRVEAWRLLTCFIYAGRFSFHTIINLHLLTQVSRRYEQMGVICTRRIPEQQNNNEQQQRRQDYTSPYYERGETSDYIFCILFGMIGILLSHVYLLPKLPYSITHNQFHRFFQRHLTFYIVYVWSKQHPNNMVNFFGMPFAAAYLPYAYLLMGYAINNQTIPVDILHGMFIGHVYFYMACIVPKVLGRRRAVIYTPVILVDLCHWLEGGVGNDDNGGVAPPLPDVDGIIGG